MTFEKAKMHEALTPGEALKMIRELQGLSQNDLARLTNAIFLSIELCSLRSRLIGVPGKIRTCDLPLRRRKMLNPDLSSKIHNSL